MGTLTETTKQVAPKKTRVLRRSRGGCRNCKLRKIKCDQSKPQCRCCLSFGVVCNYGINVPDLRPSREANSQCFGATYSWKPRGKIPIAPLRERLSSQVASKTSSITIELDTQSLGVITQLYQQMEAKFGFPVQEVFQLAQNYPFLMHATLALSLAYDRSLTLAAKPTPGRTVREMNHFFQCTTLFNRHLSDSFRPIDRDPIWATASWLSILLFLAIDECDPSKAWPFKGSETPDMEWLRMGDTKWKLYQLTNPIRPESIFHCISSIYSQMRTYIAASGIDTISSSLHKVCDLDISSQLQTNPYFHAAQTITTLENYKPSEIPLPEAMSFITHGQATFKDLLLEKDPVALLLFALWYSKVRKAVWWIGLRAATEYKAICMYLRKYHSDNSQIMELLPFEG